MTAATTAGVRYFWGPLAGFGLIAALITCAADQASKLWILRVYDLATKGAVNVAPYVDFVLTWNTGISYGWFQQEGPFGQWALLALKVIAVALLWICLARAVSRPTALALAIIGGALGNAIDRLAYGVVMVSCCCTWKPPPGASIGTFLTWPM